MTRGGPNGGQLISAADVFLKVVISHTPLFRASQMQKKNLSLLHHSTAFNVLVPFKYNRTICYIIFRQCDLLQTQTDVSSRRHCLNHHRPTVYHHRLPRTLDCISDAWSRQTMRETRAIRTTHPSLESFPNFGLFDDCTTPTA